MHDGVNAHLRLLPDPRTVEDRHAGRQETLVGDGASAQHRVGTDEDVLANRDRPLGRGANDRLLAHDDPLSKGHWTTLGGDHRAKRRSDSVPRQ